MTTAATDTAARRDAAYAELVALEAQRRTLETAAQGGDADAHAALSALRPRLSRQAVLAADLDAACDLAAAGDGPLPDTALRIAALAVRRRALAREIEGHVEAVVAACTRMAEVGEAFAALGPVPPAVTAELARFGDRLCFYLDSMLDFVTGAKGLAGQPGYRRLSEVLLDAEAILKLYRRAAEPSGGGRLRP